MERERTREEAHFFYLGLKIILLYSRHRIDLISAMKLVLSCSRFRIPEPLREDHRRASKICYVASFYTLRKRARELRLPEKPMNAPIAMSMMI